MNTEFINKLYILLIQFIHHGIYTGFWQEVSRLRLRLRLRTPNLNLTPYSSSPAK